MTHTLYIKFPENDTRLENHVMNALISKLLEACDYSLVDTGDCILKAETNDLAQKAKWMLNLTKMGEEHRIYQQPLRKTA